MVYKRYLIGFDNNYEMYGGTVNAKRRFLEESTDSNATFQDEMHQWIVKKGYQSHVEEFGEPLAVPFMSIRCTEELADILKTHPRVELVQRDGIG